MQPREWRDNGGAICAVTSGAGREEAGRKKGVNRSNTTSPEKRELLCLFVLLGLFHDSDSERGYGISNIIILSTVYITVFPTATRGSRE